MTLSEQFQNYNWDIVPLMGLLFFFLFLSPYDSTAIPKSDSKLLESEAKLIPGFNLQLLQ